MTDDHIALTPLHPRCPTYVQRSGSRTLEKVARVQGIAVGDADKYGISWSKFYSKRIWDKVSRGITASSWKTDDRTDLFGVCYGKNH